MESVGGFMSRRLETMRNKHSITLENLCINALKGVILDADGSLIYDHYDEFGSTPAIVNFDLAVAGINVKKKCADVLRHLEDNLKSEFMTGIHCRCSPEFFDALTDRAKVKDAYIYWQKSAVQASAGEEIRSPSSSP